MERTKIKIRPAKVEGARGLFQWAVFGEYEKAGVKQRHPIGNYRFPTKRGATRYAEMLLEKPLGFDTEYVKGWDAVATPEHFAHARKEIFWTTPSTPIDNNSAF